MKYRIHYSCISHVGRCRSMNQDNFICEGKYIDDQKKSLEFPLTGTLTSNQPSIIGVFDGLGGEECGEIASFIAAKCAAETTIGSDSLESLLAFCKKANGKICDYAAAHDVFSMGTTAALLVFSSTEIDLCNIGDSKVFHFADNKLEQISKDHYAIAAYGSKPPLSQNLGISPSEMIIEPYAAKGSYNDGDIYLICSDGLTDMVPEEEIRKIISENTLHESTDRLLETALKNGGKDNITIILCRVERERQNLFDRIFRLIDTRFGVGCEE